MIIVISGNKRSGKTVITSNIFDALRSRGKECAIINLCSYNIYDDCFKDTLSKEPLIETFKRPEDFDRKAHCTDLIEITKDNNYIYYSSVFNSEAFSHDQVVENLQRIIAAFNAAGKTVLIETEGEILSSGTFAAFMLADKIYYVVDESIESFKTYTTIEDLLMGYQEKISLIVTHYKNSLELNCRLDLNLQLERIKLNSLSYSNKKLKRKIEKFVEQEQLVEGDSKDDINRKVFKWPWQRGNRARQESRRIRSSGKSISKTSGDNEGYNI